MKTLIENATKESKYVWSDDVVITQTDFNVVTPHTIIADMNNANSTLIENVTPPDDWAGCKYLYDTGTWTANPKWVDLSIPMEEGSV